MKIQESKKETEALNNRALLVRGLKSNVISADLMAVDIKAIKCILIAVVVMAMVAIPLAVATTVFAVQGISVFKCTAALINQNRFVREILKR